VEAAPPDSRLHPFFQGCPRTLTVSAEATLNGILFVLHTGIPWEDLLQSLDTGSGMTNWRRLRDWNAAGVSDKLHQAILAHLGERDQINWNHLQQFQDETLW